MAVERTKMTEDQAEKFLTKYLAARNLTGAKANAHVRLVAAKRLAALARYVEGEEKPAPKKAKAKKSAAKKAA